MFAVPWGNSRPFDNLIQFGRIFWRVQVKSATAYHSSQYIVKAGSRGHSYTKDDIDFIAGHAVPENVWYIVPVEAFEGKTELHFSPHCTGHSKYEKYREAWCLLTCPLKSRGWQDIPTLCRNPELGVQCAVCPLRK